MSHRAEVLILPTDRKAPFYAAIAEADAKFGSTLTISNEDQVKTFLGDALSLEVGGISQVSDVWYCARQDTQRFKAQIVIHVDNIPADEPEKEVLEGVVDRLVGKKCSSSFSVWSIDAVRKGPRTFYVTMMFSPNPRFAI